VSPASDGLSARQAAYRILNDILFRRMGLDDAVARCGAFEKLAARDRAFVRLLVSIVLKRAREMDMILQSLLTEPIDKLRPPQLVNVFRLGMAQIAFLDTPPHAAVDTSVELAEAEGAKHFKPLVNAVLRRLAREGYPHPDPRDAGRIATPAWMWNAWVRDYGEDHAALIAAANLNEAPIDFSVKHHPEQWAETLEAELLPTGSLRKKTGGFIPELPGFTQGMWWIQNAAAALPAQLFGDLKGKTAIDLCAAPGGKTAQLAATGAKVVAVDRSAQRMERLKENMQRLNFSVEIRAADGASFQPGEPADAVLLDAPCTATGTIRHQPDVLQLKEEADQTRLIETQRRLMLNALRMLKPGGVLVYCTCSLQKAEGEYQTDWLLAQGPGLALSPIRPGEIPGIDEMITSRGELRILPTHWAEVGGMDGFYAARFLKI
jgi:16S rRNA (cytosine967-C5)-methyltransferase